MELDTLNLTQICRTCKYMAPQMQSLFEGYESVQQSVRIDEMLMFCASVQVFRGDGLPAQICQICVEQLRNAFTFKNQVEKVDSSLKEYVKNLKVEIKQELQFSDFTDDRSEPPEVTKSIDEDKVKDVGDTGLNDKKNNLSETIGDTSVNNDHSSCMAKVAECLENEINDSNEIKVEDTLKMEDNILQDGRNAVSIECNAEENFEDSEYLPQQNLLPKMRRKPGRPPKIPGRGPGRAPKIKKKEKEEEYGEFPCPACNEMFNTMRELNKHATIKHEGLKLYKCNICNREFSRLNHLTRHATSHYTAKPNRCDVCTKIFKTRSSLNQHQKLHERSNEFICNICQKAFSGADHLTNHRAAKHGIGKKVSIKKNYECLLCHKRFTTEYYRDIHVDRHSKGKEYQCSVCEKIFLSKSYLNKHKQFNHDRAKKFICSECGQQFFRKENLIIHIRRHRGEKPFNCKYCEKGFTRMIDLTVHERCHTGEKPHLCKICGKGFGRSYHLTVHMRTHTGEKPYKCKYCSAAFAQGNDLKSHTRIHTGERFHCELCNKGFVMKYRLTQHKRTIHGVNVIGNIGRLQHVQNREIPHELPPITIPLPKPVVLDNVLFNAMHANKLHSQLTMAQSHLTDKQRNRTEL